MIRFRRLTQGLLESWLIEQRLRGAHQHYRLRLWRENRSELAAIRSDLRNYTDESLDDARRKLRRGFEDNLSPFRDPTSDPATNYPALLHKITLQGYFGETLAIIAVEHFGAHGYADWSVPAFLFRFHDQEFQHLESINERLLNGEPFEPDATAERRPGRTGDDALAFRMNASNRITHILTLESKCLTSNNNQKMAEAHSKLANGPKRPTGIRELINLLEDYDTPLAQMWQQALLELWRGGYRSAERYDGVCYACGHSPAQGGRISWMPSTAPLPEYTAQRNLEGLEFQFADLDTLIDLIYR